MNIGGDVIYYTSTDGKIIVPYGNVFGAEIISNIYNDIGKIKFNGKVITIGQGAFLQKTSLTTIIVPRNVIEIGMSAFNGCSRLTSITFGDSVTTIGNNAFNYCSSLTSITIPNSVTTIGSNAFRECGSLTSVYCKATTPPSLGNTNVFDNNASGRKIYVPYQSLDVYKTATYWSEYADDIVGYDFENDTVVGG